MSYSITTLPKESTTHVFSHLEFSDLCRLPLVCKQWFFVQELVLEYVKNREKTEAIIRPLISDEEKWRRVTKFPALSLKVFQGLPNFTQSVYLWKGINIDSTPLFELLIDKIKEVACEGVEQPGRFFIDAAGRIHDAKADGVWAMRETKLLLSLAKDPISPFNDFEIRSYLLSIVAPAVPVVHKIAGRIRKILKTPRS
jgi:hypothetical protein